MKNMSSPAPTEVLFVAEFKWVKILGKVLFAYPCSIKFIGKSSLLEKIKWFFSSVFKSPIEITHRYRKERNQYGSIGKTTIVACKSEIQIG